MAEDMQDHWNRLHISQISAVRRQNPSSYLDVGQEKESWELVNHQKVKASAEAFAQLWDATMSSSSRHALNWCY